MTGDTLFNHYEWIDTNLEKNTSLVEIGNILNCNLISYVLGKHCTMEMINELDNNGILLDRKFLIEGAFEADNQQITNGFFGMYSEYAMRGSARGLNYNALHIFLSGKTKLFYGIVGACDGGTQKHEVLFNDICALLSTEMELRRAMQIALRCAGRREKNKFFDFLVGHHLFNNEDLYYALMGSIESGCKSMFEYLLNIGVKYSDKLKYLALKNNNLINSIVI
mgnify:CR=1 FL=1